MVFVIDYHTHEAAAVRDMVLTVPDVAVTKFVLHDVGIPLVNERIARGYAPMRWQ